MKPYIGMLDHSLLSPSGHISKRAKAKALKPLIEAINKGHAEDLEQSKREADTRRPERLRQYAKELRALAKRGMQPRKLSREADKLEVEADTLES